MSIAALLLLLGAALSHATWNYIAKGARNSLALTFAIVFCSVVLYVPVALGVFLWTQPSLNARALGFMLVSGLLHTVYFYLLNQGYRVGDLSLIYPLSRGTGPALAVAGAVLIYDERPTPLALAGIVLVIGGVLVLSAPRRFTAGTLGASLAFSIATGASIAAYTLWDKEGVSTLTPVVYAFGIDVARLAIVAPFALGTVAARRALSSEWRAQRRAILAIGALTPAAYMMVLGALASAPVSYVAPAREISILFGAAMGLRFLNESYPAQRVSGALAIVAGVLALALG